MDDDEVLMSPTRPIDIPAKFIRQAFEHLQHTNARYVTFLFANEMVMDAVCTGVSTSTRRALSSPPVDTFTARPDSALDEMADLDEMMDDSQPVNKQQVLAIVTKHGPINTREVGDALGIGRKDANQRQRIHRVLKHLQKHKSIRVMNTDERYPQYVPTTRVASPSMPRRPFTRTIHRRDITPEMVLEHLRSGKPLTSRTIGDLIGVPRPDAHVRSKITEVMGGLVSQGLVKKVGKAEGNLYQITEPQVIDESALS